MKNEERASLSIMKIICFTLIIVLVSGIGAMAVTTNLKDIKIVLKNGYEMTILTAKETVSEILEENNIILEENQKTIPGDAEKVNAGSIIKIVDKSYNEVQIAKASEEGTNTTLDELLDNYAPIVERIVVEQEEIPYETVTKNTSNLSSGTTNKVLQQGKNGLKEVTYKIKYQNENEIERIVLSEEIIREPVDKIVQVTAVTTRSGINDRNVPSTTPVTDGTIFKVTAYCSCARCCGKTNGITAMGTRATAGRTVAASSQFAFGTELNINGHVYTVEDRGGAIRGNRIDIYMNSHAEALAWGVRYLPVSVVE